MNELWRRVGMDDNLISTRRARVAEEIETLMGNMLNEEEMMERKIRDNLLRFTEESRVVAIQLGMESEELNEVSVNCSNESTGAIRDGLVSQESRVRKLIIRLNDIKKKRSEVIENLVADGNRLCKSLGEDPLQLERTK
uniref:Uncharacterized protein n=1 Tax=Ciona savignyi TaxID=51511 RepID=H2ZPG6_CIOSA